MIRLNSLALSIVLFLATASFSLTAVAGDELELKTAAATAEFKAISSQKDDLAKLPRAFQKRIEQAFDHMSDLFLEVAGSSIDPSEKSKLIKNLAAAGGKTFQDLTEPYSDVSGFEGISDSEARYMNGIQRFFVRAGRFISFIATSVLRDLGSVFNPHGSDGRVAFPTAWSIGIPFTPIGISLGDDAKRSDVVRTVGKELEKSLDQSANPVAVEALRDIIDEMSRSEPVQYGASNKLAYWTYLGFAAFSIFHPLIDFFPQRTYFSTFVSGIILTSAAAAGAIARSSNSGLKFYKVVGRCQQALGKKASR